jgi:hypothetical protein
LKATIAAAFLSVAVGAQTAPNSDRTDSDGPGASLGLSVRPNLESGHSWVEVLPTHDRDIAVFAAALIDVPGNRLVEWARHVELLYKNRYVPVIGRLSNPPRIEDLHALALDDKDLEDIRKCEPGDCGVKLSGPEIDQLQQTVLRAGGDWKDAVQDTFRHIVLARAERYLSEGDRGALPYKDKKKPVWPESEFAAIIDQSELAIRDFPHWSNYLKLYPRIPDPSIESFLYWSKEKIGARPIISVTHVNIIRPAEEDQLEALIVAKQVYASHYMTGALSMTAITSGAGGSYRYLVYLNRSRTDVFDGMFARWVRRIVERRLRSEGPAAIDALRLRLESGPPRPANLP